MWLQMHPPQLLLIELLKDAHVQDACYASGLQLMSCIPRAAGGAQAAGIQHCGSFRLGGSGHICSHQGTCSRRPACR